YQKDLVGERLREVAEEIFTQRLTMFHQILDLEWLQNTRNCWIDLAMNGGHVVWSQSMQGYTSADVTVVVRRLREMEEHRAKKQAKIHEPPPDPFAEAMKQVLLPEAHKIDAEGADAVGTNDRGYLTP